MATGILIDYEYCTGCHSCEIACAVSHDLPNKRCGVHVHHEGAWPITEQHWQDAYLPVFTDACNLCKEGESAHDGVPMCVHHCQANVIKIGDLDTLSKELAIKSKQVLYSF